MVERRFDEITRKLALGADRRTVLRGVGGLALGSLGLLALQNGAAAQEDDTITVAGRRCRRACLRRCRRRDGDDCRERCCEGGDDD